VVRYGDNRELRYDALSINTGAAPNCPFDLPHVIPVKPIGQFLPGWQTLLERLTTGATLAVIGGGAGGFEIALAAQRQLGSGVSVTLLTSGELLPEHGERVRALGKAALEEAGIELRTEFRVADIQPDMLESEAGDELLAAGVLWVTGVSAPEWVQHTALGLDADGYIEVDRLQRSVSHPEVYAAGDIAGMRDQPRPKSGVFAVRQGPVLARNLRAAVLEQPADARPYRAQSRFLALLNCADGTAIASYAGLAFRHKLLWKLKDRIDSAFMDKFSALPQMSAEDAPVAADYLRSDELGDGMRCGGCGSKINATLLNRVLKNLAMVDAPQVVQGIGDDAAVLKRPAGALVLTTDGFRAMVDDTRLFGRIAAHHALSDIYAMGARPTSVLVNATVPLMSEAMMEQELRELLEGVQSVLGDQQIPLVGGHSAEGAELAVSLTVAGELAKAPALSKTTGLAGDALILTKGLGTGCVLAAAMRGECDTETWRGCLEALDSSNRDAAAIASEHSASACTDVTGFGFAGHLFEMLGGDTRELGVQVNLSRVPALDGALEVLKQGVKSSLHEANARALEVFEVAPALVDDARLQLLADPQTGGGLLVALPAENAASCVTALKNAGYAQAAVVGQLVEGACSVAE